MKFQLHELSTQSGPFYAIQGPNGFNTIQPHKETAEFVVRACNTQPELFDALADLVEAVQSDPKFRQIPELRKARLALTNATP